MLIFSLPPMCWHLPITVQYSVVFRLFIGVKMVLQAKPLNVGVDTLKVNVKLHNQAQALPVELEVHCSICPSPAQELVPRRGVQSSASVELLLLHLCRQRMLAWHARTCQWPGASRPGELWCARGCT